MSEVGVAEGVFVSRAVPTSMNGKKKRFTRRSMMYLD